MGPCHNGASTLQASQESATVQCSAIFDQEMARTLDAFFAITEGSFEELSKTVPSVLRSLSETSRHSLLPPGSPSL